MGDRPRLIIFAPYNTPNLWDLPGLLTRLSIFECRIIGIGDPATLVSVNFPDGSVWFTQGDEQVCLKADLFVSLPFNYSPFFRLLRPAADPPFQGSQFIVEQWIAMVDYIDLVLEDKNWINKPSAARRAANKLITMRKALAQGLTVPCSVFTNDPSKVLDTFSTERILSKVLGYHNEYTKDVLLPASNFARSEIQAASSEITSMPACYQEIIDSVEQLRFYIFPDEHICVGQRSYDDCGLPDWRFHDSAKMEFYITDKYNEYGDVLTSFCRSMDIQYAAIDVLVKDEGFILLDVNPNGTWRWLEQSICISIQEAFERMLVGTVQKLFL